MPVNWKPKETRIRELIAEEQVKLDALQERRRWQSETMLPAPPIARTTLPEQTIERSFIPAVSPTQPRETGWTPFAFSQEDPLTEEEKRIYGYEPPQLPNMGKIIPVMGKQEWQQPRQIMEAPLPVQLPQPISKPAKEAPISVPFWQRALQIFAAPFNWVDETIIKPGLAILGTTAGFVPEVERKAGEDFWEWKKRSWAGWETPGIDVNVPWSDKPLRLDFKGVMELAPWLLIPGAGQVGGATGLGARLAGKVGERVARGLAGAVGKAGLPGRVVGTAIEYSPWGLAEKTAGVAIKGGFRAVGAVSARVSTKVGEKLYGKYVPPPVPPEVAELTKYFEQAVMPSYRKFRKLVPEEVTAKQTARIEEQFTRARRGEITFTEAYDLAAKARGETGIKQQFAMTAKALAARKAEEIAVIENKIANGEYTEAVGKALITKIKKSPAFTAVPFTSDKVEKLINQIDSMAESGHVKLDTGQALKRLLLNGELPERHNLRDFTTAFGVDFARAVGRLDSPSRANQILDALNIPRAIIASWDVSATARQGLILSLLHPIQAPKWFGRQVKALFSEKWALEIDDVMRAAPLWKEFTKTGAYVAPLREATFTTAEEMFASRTARVIPGIRRSERAFATYLNQARFDAFKSAYNAMSAQGATDAQFKLLGEFLDVASGRGRMPESLDRFMPALNLALFSPRLQAATLQLPRQLGRMLISDNPYMRKEAAKALITFVGGGVGLLSLLNNTGVAKVEKDPRSGDFGKIRFKIGEDANGQPKYSETRLDIWRGYLQYSRFAAQLLTGERKSAYANMNKAERGEIAWRFIQSKASPAVGLMVDLLRGELYSGEPIFKDTTGFIKAARGKLIPLAVQDIVDAMEQSGINGVAVAAPALLGVGALTYVNDFVRVKEKIAKEMGFESWDDIDPKSQREIENRNAELQVATIAFDRQVMGTAWGDWRLAGKAVENIFRQNIDNIVNKYRQDGLGVDFRNKVSDAWTERRGAYKTREVEPRFEDIVKRMKVQDTLESFVGSGPEGVAIRLYQETLYGDDMYDEFGDYRFDEANVRKELLRRQLGDEMFDYVEQYQGVRYQDLPQEFQDLQEAKRLMKPYWAVADQVVRLFGQRYADSNRGKALISKRRKQMRLRNPELNRAFERFYSQS